MKQEPKSRALDRVLITFVVIFLLLPPLALGGVAPWARSILFMLAALLFGVWVLKSVQEKQIRIVRHPIWLFITIFFALAVFQLVPLSPEILGGIQQATVDTYAATLPEYAEGGEARPLSFCPYDTSQEILRIAVLAMIFFIVVNTVRTRQHITCLIMALVAIGTFEALYGFYEQFSGRRNIFWMSHPYASDAVTGTFLNKNHFAGLLEMIVPLAFCSFFVIRGQRTKMPRQRLTLKVIGVYLSTSLASRRFLMKTLLTSLGVVMSVGVLFSLSRAGIFSLAAALCLVALFAIVTAGFRRYSLIMAGLVLLVLAVAGSIGMSTVIERVDDAASGQSAQWMDRVDLSRSSLAYIKDYPVLGTGAGTFGSVFPQYQSGRFGDRWANFLHNDWLQLFCEMGFVGGGVLILGLCWFLISTIRNLRARKISFGKWIAVGGLLGVGAMLIHSYFDYNLSRITSNGIVFAVVLGIAYRASLLSGDDSVDEKREKVLILPLGPAPVRMAFVALALLGLAAGVFLASSPLEADIQFNRYLASSPLNGKTEDYFFLDVDGSIPFGVEGNDEQRGEAKPEDFLKHALDQEPDNPRYSYSLALEILEKADTLVQEAALENAGLLTGGMEGAEASGIKTLAASIAMSIKGDMLEERRPYLVAAEKVLRQAIHLAPTCAEYHLTLGGVIQELKPCSLAGLSEIKTALRLSPNKPQVLHETGLFFLSWLRSKPLHHATSNPEADSSRRAVTIEVDGASLSGNDLVLTCFRKAIQGDPVYAPGILQVVQATYDSPDMLVEATPRTPRGYEVLLNVLEANGDWKKFNQCLGVFEEITADNPKARLVMARKKCKVLSIQGRWEDQVPVIKEYRQQLRRSLESDIQVARHLRKRSRHKEAMRECIRILNKDWGNPEALIEAAEIAFLPRVAGQLPSWNEPLDQLYRLVIHDESLSEELYQRARDVIKFVELGGGSNGREVDFLKGAAAVRGGHVEEGIEMLLKASRAGVDAGRSLQQHHMIWYFLGIGFEKLHLRDEAAGAFQQVVDQVPTHLESLCKLVKSGKIEYRARVAALTPTTPFRVDFGGRVVLLGYRLWQEEEESGQPFWNLAFHWELRERLQSGYRVWVRLLDETWEQYESADHPITAPTTEGRPSPICAPRTGEVIVTRVKLRKDPGKAAYLQVRLQETVPQEGDEFVLYHSWGINGVYSKIVVDRDGPRVRH